MSALRIFETPTGPTCGSCVEEKYGPTIVRRPSGAYDVDHEDVYPYEANAWTGGLLRRMLAHDAGGRAPVRQTAASRRPGEQRPAGEVMKIILCRRAMRAFKIGLRADVARDRWSAARRRAFLERAS